MAKKNTYDAGSISVLEGLEAVRKRPGMYIGSVSRKGLNHLIYEIVDNAVDEHLAGYCSLIHVILEKDGSCTVTDNGRGIPVDMHEKGVSAERLVFTTLHAGGKFDNSAYKTSGGLHGVGSSVVNALSTYLDIKISRDGYVHHDHYERGIPTIELEEGLLPKLGKTRQTGTSINFLPDPEIFEKTRFSATEVKSRLHETAYLNPELTIRFEDKRGAEVEDITYHEPDGIIGFIKDLNHSAEVLHDPVYLKGEADGIQVEVAFQFTNEFRENVLGFCNNIYNAEGGTHLTGFKTTFTTVMNTYAREIGVLKDKDPNFTGADIRNGMTAVVSIKHPEPRFEGQTKTKLDNQDASRATGKVVGEQMVLYFDRNLETLKTILSCAEKAAKIRKTLLILCEEGEEEYDMDKLKLTNTVVEVIEDEEDLTPQRLAAMDIIHQPERVVIEYNGMWLVSKFEQMELPEGWGIEQEITCVDATTYQVYMANMKSLFMDMIRNTDMVVFNRCKEGDPLPAYRRGIKVANQSAEVIFENEEGEMDDIFQDEMPFDINAPIIEIPPEDYGIWFVDAMDNPDKYVDKIVRFKGRVMKPRGMGSKFFVPGRVAMTCCADDTTFLGYVCRSDYAPHIKEGSWVEVTAKVAFENRTEYQGEGIVLYASDVKECEPLKEEMVYFN